MALEVARMAASEAKSFAMAASRVKGSPASHKAAARWTMRRAADSSVAMSASMKAMAWCSAMGFPKVRRSRA
jgi:hypothetical protein